MKLSVFLSEAATAAAARKAADPASDGDLDAIIANRRAQMLADNERDARREAELEEFNRTTADDLRDHPVGNWFPVKGSDGHGEEVNPYTMPRHPDTEPPMYVDDGSAEPGGLLTGIPVAALVREAMVGKQPKTFAERVEAAMAYRPGDLEAGTYADTSPQPMLNFFPERHDVHHAEVSPLKTPWIRVSPSDPNATNLPRVEFPLIESMIQQRWLGTNFIDETASRMDAAQGGANLQVAGYQPSGSEIIATADKYGLSDSFFDKLASARSPDDLDAIGNAYGTRVVRDRQIAQSATGVGGFIAENAVNMLDPSFVLTLGGVGEIAKVGSSTTRFGNALRAATANALTVAPVEAGKAAIDPGYTWDQAGHAVLGAVALGGVLGALSKGARPEVAKRFDEAIAKEVEHANTAGGSSVGAAQVSPILREAEPREATLPEVVPEKAGFGRFGTPTFRLASSNDPAVRVLNEKLGWDTGSSTAQGVTVTEASRRVFEAGTVYNREARQAAQAYFSEQGELGNRIRNPMQQPSTQQLRDFNELVAKVHAGVAESDNPHVLKAVRAFQNGYEDALRYTQNSSYNGPGSEGLRGISNHEFANVEYDPRYVMRRFSAPGWRRVVGLLGPDRIVDKLANVIHRSNIDWITERARKIVQDRSGSAASEADIQARGVQIARQIATKYRDTVAGLLNHAATRDHTFMPMDNEFRKAAMEVVRQQFNDGAHFTDDVEEAAEMLMDLVAPIKRTTKESARVKHRLRMDLREGLDDAILPMFDWNAEALYNAYRRQTAGYAGFLKAGFQSVAEVKSQIEQLRRDAQYRPEKQQNAAGREADLLDHMVDAALGRPPKNIVEGSREWIYWTTQIRRMNFAHMMGNTGFLSLSEVGGSMVQAGPFRLLSSLPAYLKYMSDIRAGNAEAIKSIYYTADALMGHGSAQVRSRLQGFASHVDDEFGSLDRDSAGVRDKINIFTRKSANLTARASGMAPLTEWLRSAVVGIESQDWVLAARKGKVPYGDRRMRAMGVDEGMWQRISAQLNKMEDIVSPDTRQARPFIDFEKWDDGEAANVFINALDRNVRRLILEGDHGHTSFNLKRPSLSLLFQFLNYPMNAWSKQAMFAFNVRDQRAAAETIAMSLGGAVGYMARVAATAYLVKRAGTQRDKYLAENLTSTEVAKAAFYYSAHASILPNLIDLPLSVANVAHVKDADGHLIQPLFSKTRASGLAADPLVGNPTRSGIYAMIRSAGEIGDGKASREDAADFVKAWAPLGNHILTQAFMNHAMGWLPDDSELGQDKD
jgi:hypothetical protein